MLNGKEKIWYLISRILDEREIKPDEEVIGIKNDLILGKYDGLDLQETFNALEKARAASLEHTPTDQTWNRYLVKILPDFDAYVTKLEEDPEYLEWSGKKPKPKNYFSPERRVDFSKSKEENKDKYISVGQIEELMKMPKDERVRIEKDNLTKEHLDDITEFQDGLREASKVLQQKAEAALSSIRIPKINFPDVMKTNTVALTLPPDYQAQSVGLLKQLVEQQKEKDKKDNKAVLTITYTSSLQVMLNGIFQLAKPTLNGTNDLVFNHLYQNPGKSFSKHQLETAIGQKISKTLHKIVENLGFKGDLAKAFFSVSKNNILFRNPLTRSELNDMGLGNIKLDL